MNIRRVSHLIFFSLMIAITSFSHLAQASGDDFPNQVAAPHVYKCAFPQCSFSTKHRSSLSRHQRRAQHKITFVGKNKRETTLPSSETEGAHELLYALYTNHQPQAIRAGLPHICASN